MDLTDNVKCTPGCITFSASLRLWPEDTLLQRRSTGQPLTSPSYGLGWRFMFEVVWMPRSVLFTNRGDKGTISSIRLLFDPATTDAAFTKFSILVTAGVDPNVADSHDNVSVAKAALQAPAPLCSTTVECSTSRQPTQLGCWPYADFKPLSHLQISITTSTSSVIAPTNASKALQTALVDSLHAQQFADVKFYLYSRRSEGGQVYCPRIVYASKMLCVAKSDYLRRLLSPNGFQEGTSRSMRDEPSEVDMTKTLDEYDYDSDSDMDDDDLVSSVKADQSDFVSVSELPDSVSCDKIDACNKCAPSTSAHIVPLKAFAYQTWQAYIFYLYTGCITFAPLTSQSIDSTHEVAEGLETGSENDATDSSIPCSAKSLYRLASIVDDTDLRDIALAALKDMLSANNIVDELFTKFTSTHDQVLAMEVEMYMKHRKSATVQAALENKIRAFSRGELQHACAAVLAVLNRL